MEKKPNDIDDMMDRIREAILPYPKAVLFELYERGYRTSFEQLLACMISIRTRDETTLVTALELFARARTPTEILALPVGDIDKLIRASSFHENKAIQMKKIAQKVLEDYGGEVPCDAEMILGFPGIGLKCANLILGIACKIPRVSADVHVHRITNRWGYVESTNPEKTSELLEAKLPKRYWIEINSLLVPFGKHICTGTMPKCSTCPVLIYCRQVGVTTHR
ncbi:MAG: endonuclease III [Chloroflexi bacterium]|nr:MAG: endonuclease III [Chloroflexota bacterium]